MNSPSINCKEIFREAYERRYTWPDTFNGYKGKCLFIDDKRSLEGQFTLGKNFKAEVTNIDEEQVIKSISSQLFEVSIHRVKRKFEEVHNKNEFKFIKESENGLEMKVLGKNEGDKYRVYEKKINMVYRQIHGVIINIFVEDFLDTGLGFLSKRYTSQQLDVNNQSPKSQPLEYLDHFTELNNSGIWVLESRFIKYFGVNNDEFVNKFFFKDISEI